MTDRTFTHRLQEVLEPILQSDDPRRKLSAYNDMPYALFVYDPEHEFQLRGQVRMLGTRLEQHGKRVHLVSLAECLEEAMLATNSFEEWYAVEREHGVNLVIQTITEVLADYAPLIDLVAKRLPADPDPTRDVVFIRRAGALFPAYRTFSLLEQLKGRLHVPTVLFYPGHREGPAGLRFMGELDAEHNYRPKIF
ncbi:BREX protein BrxB domain-containing protein [Parafrankia sp. FMc2]|uniref:BREX protein BrxB domain-containing protein n=1 Tax=Parafrankia sp. FMc2 TaxID=3233196 RepID=UPI0034D4E7FF